MTCVIGDDIVPFFIARGPILREWACFVLFFFREEGGDDDNNNNKSNIKKKTSPLVMEI